MTDRRPLSRDEIRKIALENGFTIKEGNTDLKEYVYTTIEKLIAEYEKKNA